MTILKTPISPKRRTICFIGDSMTSSRNLLEMTADKFPPHQLQKLLQANGYPVLVRNFGRQGNTTGLMILRSAQFTKWGVPDVAIFNATVNDDDYDTTVQASPTPTTTTFTVGAGKGAGYQIGSYLTVVVGGTTYSRLISNVSTDAITISTALPSAPSAGDAVSIDTTANIVKMANDLIALGTQRIVVCGMGYENIASGSGGDTLATPYAPNVALRVKQAAAATAIGANATYVDLWTPMRAQLVAEIDAGTNSEGSGTWNIDSTNIHYNAVGSQILAGIIKDAILASTALKAAISVVTDV